MGHHIMYEYCIVAVVPNSTPSIFAKKHLMHSFIGPYSILGFIIVYVYWFFLLLFVRLDHTTPPHYSDGCFLLVAILHLRVQVPTFYCRFVATSTELSSFPRHSVLLIGHVSRSALSRFSSLSLETTSKFQKIPNQVSIQLAHEVTRGRQVAPSFHIDACFFRIMTKVRGLQKLAY